MPNRRFVRFGSLLCAIAAASCTGDVEPEQDPAGRAATTTTQALEAGAALLQPHAPAGALDVYLSGFHPLKDEPSHQIDAHHFCNQVNEDFMQCALFDGNTADARLNGVEYIVSARLFEQLPEGEQRFWHPHNGEILSGQLLAPGIPEAAEHELMKRKINSYGKTWHTWMTPHGAAGGELPLGEPRLAWSFNRFGEARPELVEQRDRELGIDSADRREARQDLVPLARPQVGVDALHGRFGDETRSIPGVADAAAGGDAPAPESGEE